MSAWIRSRSWDGAWILSGLPLGLVLLGISLCVAPPALTLLGTAVLGFAHVLSPIVLAWVHPGTRSLALSRPAKFIALPVVILLASATVGWITSSLPPLARDLSFQSVTVQTSSYRNPLVLLMLVYMVWNAYHFGMQNFGVLTLYRVNAGARVASDRAWDRWFCLVTIAVATALPIVPHLAFRSVLFEPVEWCVVALALGSIALLSWRQYRHGWSTQRVIFIVATALTPLLTLWWAFWAHGASVRWPWLQRVPLWPGLWAFALLSMNHWLVSIGLAAHVFSRRGLGPVWMFPAAMLVAGAALFALLFVDLPSLSIRVTALAVSIRLGIGFVHFCYDRWLYKLSDPSVRATIGADLCALPGENGFPSTAGNFARTSSSRRFPSRSKDRSSVVGTPA